jgi:hypothetical protein
MMSRYAFAALLGLAAPAFAQTASLQAPTNPQNPCFDVVTLAHDPSLPALAVMVDRCSGRTWALMRTVSGVMWVPIPEFKKPPQ